MSLLQSLADVNVGYAMPDDNELTVGMTALAAQQEREAISRRTRAARAAAKAKGAELWISSGVWKGAQTLRREGMGAVALCGVVGATLPSPQHAFSRSKRPYERRKASRCGGRAAP